VKLDLNCDLGEGEPIARTAALMRSITSANVACGGHAGNSDTMEQCVRLAKKDRVRLGAHPGPRSRGDFGRGAVAITPDEFEMLLVHQVSALEKIARMHGIRLHHVKLHGALYHASDADPELARRYFKLMKRWWPGCVIYALAGGPVAEQGRKAGVGIWPEVFADRGYRDDGTLVPRDEPGAVLHSGVEVARRVRLLLGSGELEANSGRRLVLMARTMCVHSDTSDAVALARRIRRVIED